MRMIPYDHPEEKFRLPDEISSLMSERTLKNAVAIYKQQTLKTRSTPHAAIWLAAVYYTLHYDKSCPAIDLNTFLEKTVCTDSEAFGWIHPKQMRKVYRAIISDQGKKAVKCALRPTIFLRAYMEKNGTPEQIQKIAYDLNEKVIRRGLHMSKHPSSVAASEFFIATLMVTKNQNERITIAECAKAFGVTSSTVSHIYRMIMRELDIDIWM